MTNMIFIKLITSIWFMTSNVGQCANILILPMHAFMSHKKQFWPLAESLTNRGHQVHFWNIHFIDSSRNSSLVPTSLHYQFNAGRLQDHQVMLPISDHIMLERF